jgi:hypothetical protein
MHVQPETLRQQVPSAAAAAFVLQNGKSSVFALNNAITA